MADANSSNSGALHIDYDALAHQIVEPGGVALPQIVAEFGPDALLADGTMNRPWIADHVFGANAAPGARERLDAIEHPLIYAEVARLEHEHPSSHHHSRHSTARRGH